MSDYARLRVLAEVDSYSTFPNPSQHSAEVSFSADEWICSQKIDATTAGATVELGAFDTITSVTISNSSTTLPVRVVWYQQIGTKANPGGAGITLVVGPPGVITDAAATGNMITSGAAVGRWVRLASSENSANDGLHCIQACTADTLTTPDTLNATVAPPDTSMTFSFEVKNEIMLAAQGVLCIAVGIVPASDIVLYTASATATCRVTITGT